MDADAFFARKPLVGMVHLGPLPGAARWGGRLDAVVERAVADAHALEDGGADALLIENFFDAPFHKDRVPPETIAGMTAAALAVRAAVDLPMGVNVLRNDVRSAIAIAHVVGARFVRCNVYVGAVIADQGLIEGAAREAVVCRRGLGADVLLWADIGVKHAVPLAETPLGQQARDAVERGLADALIVTGPATGSAPPADRLREVRLANAGAPIVVGSGLTTSNAREAVAVADGAIVGTALKVDGLVANPVDPTRVRALVAALRG